MKKYKLNGDTKEINGHTLHRIQALKDFSDVKKGDLGGWVESEDNLSQYGNCWVYDNACVYDNASISDNAKVSDWAWISGNVCVSGNAKVSDDANISGDVKILGNVIISDDSWVYGDSEIHGNVYKYEYDLQNAYNQIVNNNITIDIENMLSKIIKNQEVIMEILNKK